MKYVKTLMADPATLEGYPGNAKLHAEEDLDASVATGQFRSVLARQLDDGQLQLLAGHGTTDALRRSMAKKVRVEVIVADDDEALRIVVADNEIGRKAGYDEARLAELLRQLDEGSGFAGSGFDSAGYDDLLAKLAAAAETPLPLGEQDENTWRAATGADERDRYELKGTRTVAFDYSYPVFVWLAEQLTILREREGVESNSDLFVLLIERETDSKAPESLDDEAGPEQPEDDASGQDPDPDDEPAKYPVVEAGDGNLSIDARGADAR